MLSSRANNSILSIPKPALLIVTIVCLLGTLSSCGEPATPSERPVPPQRYEFRRWFTAGEELTLITRQCLSFHPAATEGPQGGRESSSSIRFSLATAQSVDGALQVRVAVDHVQGSRKKDGKESVYDSDHPQDAEPGESRNYLLLKGRTIGFIFDSKGDMRGATGEEEFLAALQPPKSGPLELSTWHQKLLTVLVMMIRSPWSYLPAEPKAIGESWTYRGEAAPIHGPIGIVGGDKVPSEETTCRLEGVRESSEGRIAVIAIEGRILKDPGVGDHVISGRIEYFLDKPVHIHEEVTLRTGQGSPEIVQTDSVELFSKSKNTGGNATTTSSPSN